MIGLLIFLFVIAIIFGIPALGVLASAVRIISQYQKGVVLSFGKFNKVLEPGINFVVPIRDRVIVVDTRICTIDIPKQEVMTKDNVPVYINAVVYMRVEDPVKAVLRIKDYKYAVAQYGQTALRDVVGNKSLDELLTDREGVAEEIKRIVDQETSDWGVDITAIKLQDINLPDNMKRAMARQAEAEREKRGIIIKSEGEITAALNLSKAAAELARTPGALHLRTLQTLNDISGDPSVKYVLCLPVEVLDAFKAVSNSPLVQLKPQQKTASKSSSKKSN